MAAKKFNMSLKTQEPIFGVEYPEILPAYVPENLRKKACVQFLSPRKMTSEILGCERGAKCLEAPQNSDN